MVRLVTAASAISLFISAMNPGLANLRNPGTMGECKIMPLVEQVRWSLDRTGRIDNEYLAKIARMGKKGDSSVGSGSAIIQIYLFEGGSVEAHYLIPNQVPKKFSYKGAEAETEDADSTFPWKYVINFKMGGSIIYFDTKRDGINGNEAFYRADDLPDGCHIVQR